MTVAIQTQFSSATALRDSGQWPRDRVAAVAEISHADAAIEPTEARRFFAKSSGQVAKTALYYYGFRHYDPVTGRWPSRGKRSPKRRA